MTREEKCNLAKTRGYSYNAKTGKILNKHGKQIKKSVKCFIVIQMKIEDKVLYLYGHHFVWWLNYSECKYELDHINGIKNDNRIENLRIVTKHKNKWSKF